MYAKLLLIIFHSSQVLLEKHQPDITAISKIKLGEVSMRAKEQLTIFHKKKTENTSTLSNTETFHFF